MIWLHLQVFSVAGIPKPWWEVPSPPGRWPVPATMNANTCNSGRSSSYLHALKWPVWHWILPAWCFLRSTHQHAPSFSPGSREHPGTPPTYCMGDQKWQRIWPWLPSVTSLPFSASWHKAEDNHPLTVWIRPPKSFLLMICPVHLCRTIYNIFVSGFVQLYRKENTEGTWFILQDEAYEHHEWPKSRHPAWIHELLQSAITWLQATEFWRTPALVDVQARWC